MNGRMVEVRVVDLSWEQTGRAFGGGKGCKVDANAAAMHHNTAISGAGYGRFGVVWYGRQTRMPWSVIVIQDE